MSKAISNQSPGVIHKTIIAIASKAFGVILHLRDSKPDEVVFDAVLSVSIFELIKHFIGNNYDNYNYNRQNQWKAGAFGRPQKKLGNFRRMPDVVRR